MTSGHSSIHVESLHVQLSIKALQQSFLFPNPSCTILITSTKSNSCVLRPQRPCKKSENDRSCRATFLQWFSQYSGAKTATPWRRASLSSNSNIRHAQFHFRCKITRTCVEEKERGPLKRAINEAMWFFFPGTKLLSNPAAKHLLLPTHCSSRMSTCLIRPSPGKTRI